MTGELGLAELNHKVDQLTSLLSNVAPVVQTLKAAYDTAQEEDDKYLHLLTVFWRQVSMSQLYLNGKKTSRGQKIVNFSV